MPKPELGKKRTCLDCGAHYYDLNAEKPKCPKCGAPFALAVPIKGKAKDKKPPKDALVATDESDDDDDVIGDDDDLDALVDDDDDENLESDDEDEDLIADASDLGDDEDDFSEVLEHMDKDGGDARE